MSLIKKLAGQTAIYGLSHIISRVLLFVVFTIYLTRKFSEVEYGIYSDMYSYATVIGTILVFRMDTAIFRYGSKEGMEKIFATSFFSVIGFCILALAVLLTFVDPIAEILQYDNSPHYIRWFAYFLVLDAIAAPIFAKLRLEGKAVRFVIYKLLNIFLTVAFILIFLELMPTYFADKLQSINTALGLTGQVDFVFLTNLIASAVVLLAMLPELRGMKMTFDKALFKKMLWYVVPLVFVGISGNINQAFAAPLQKTFLGDNLVENLASVGVYAAAAKLAILLNLFTTAFNYAAEPFFFNNADNKDSIKVYGKVALAFAIVACLATLGLVFYIDVVILLLGENYRSGVNVVPILLFAYVFLGLYYNVSIWYKLKDKTYIGALISFIGVFVTLVMSIVLLPSWGAIASAWSALACYISMVIVGYLVGQRYYPVQYPVAKILGYIAGAALLTIGCLWLQTVLGASILYFSIVTLCFATVVFFLYRREWKGLSGA